MALDLTDANAFRAAIRYDPLTKKGSVYDVIQIVTGQDHRHAQKTYTSIVASFPDVNDNVSMHKFPGQGQRPTPVASLPVLFRVMASCPGSRAREFCRSSMDVFCRAFGGDETLAREMSDAIAFLDMASEM